MVLVNFNGGSVSDPNFPNNFTEQIPPTGSVYRLISTKPNDVNDSFTFNAPTVEQSMAKAKTDVEKSMYSQILIMDIIIVKHHQLITM